MKTYELKACPFCGSEANQPEDISVRLGNGERHPGYEQWWQVMCANKECRAWRAAGSPAVVAHKWNLRAGVKLPNASNKGQAQGSSAEASCYAALLEHIKTLRRIIIEHHSSTVMRDEVCVCPICAEKENATVLDESYKITAA